MNYLLNNKTNTIANRISALLIILLFITFSATAQNINIPNKTGPMGLEVNSYTGNLFFERTDFIIEGAKLNMLLKFSYNSYDLDKNRGYGNSWSFQYDVHYKSDTANNIFIVWGDGREDLYQPFGDGNFKSPVGFFTVLKEYEPGKFSLTQPEGVSYLFENNTHKRLTKIDEPNGNFISVQHTDTSITSLTNNYGQSIQLAYNTKGWLISITDAITSPTRIWTYKYDDLGNLITVTDPLGAKDSYSYLINGPVKSVTDKNLNVVDLVYYNDFSISEMVGCNKRMSFSYDTTQKITVITDYLESGLNQVNKYYYTKIEKLISLSAISSNCCGFDIKIEYDNQGNKIKQTDANGNVTKYTYDDRGNVLTITDALNQTTTYTYTKDFNRVKTLKNTDGIVFSMEYDDKGNLVQLIEPDNSVYSATYDASGKMIGSINPAGITFSYTYDPNGNLKTVSGPESLNISMNFSPRGDLTGYTDPNDNSSSFQYDILGRMTKLTDPLNHQAEFSYDASGNLILVKNKNNESASYDYDASNRLRVITRPTGSKTTLDYDAMGNIISQTNAEGATSKYSINDKNQLATITDAEGNETTFNYDRNGNLITKNLPNGQARTYTYDALNRIKEISDQYGTIFKIDYDANDNITSLTDASGAVQNYEYDKQNRIKKYSDPLGNNINLTYNELGKTKTVKDPNGSVMEMSYDNLNRLTSIKDNNGSITAYIYDPRGNIISLTDANNNTTNYTYDALNRIIKKTFPDGKFTEYTYNGKNNITSNRKKDGTIISYVYDSLDRLKTKTVPGDEVYSYEYDKTGKVIFAANNSGTVEFTYDFLNRITSEISNGKKVNYSYDINGRIQKTIYPDNTEITKIFDKRNRLISIQKNNFSLVTYQYNNSNLITNKTFGNGITTNLQYDFTGRLTNITSGGLQNLAYTYDNKGNLNSIIRGSSNFSEFFTYDNANRLLTYKRGKNGGSSIVNDSYTYDALGNRISAFIDGKTINYTTNNLNQILNKSKGTETINYIYDDNGNLTFDGKFFKTYDSDKRLMKDSASPTEVITYQYDAIGRKIRKTINGISSLFSYSGLQPIEERDQNGVLKNRTIFKNFLTPVLNEKNGISFYYQQDHLNNVELLTDGSGSLAEQYRYDVYGKQTIYDANDNLISGSLTGNRFGFTGQVYDSATGHNQFVFRNYNPETGLFDQQDLIGYSDGMGLYQYVGNNPANGIDILGLRNSANAVVVYVDEQDWENEVNRMRENLYDNRFESFYNLAVSFADSKYHQEYESIYRGGNNGDKCKQGNFYYNFRGRLYSSTELNYYFEGMLFKMYGMSRNDLSLLVNTWRGSYEFTNGHNWRSALSPIQNATVYSNVGGSDKMNEMANLGYDETSSKELSDFFSPLAKQDPYHASDFTSYEDPAGLPPIPDGDRYGKYRHVKDFNTHEIRLQYFLFDLPLREEHRNSMLEHERKMNMAVNYKKPDCPQNGNPNGTQRPPHGPHKDGPSGRTRVLQSNDPNEMIGPKGQPDKRWVSVNDRLPYTVTYENSEMATAPAKYVKVIVPAHEKMDPSTFQLSNLGFNNMTFNVPPMSPSNYQRLDARDSLGLLIDMTAGFDPMKNEFFWEFQSINPVTMMPPSDPLKGFLLMQDTTELKTNNGHGFVTFSVKPVANAQTLDSILAYASIVFDQNDTIPTNIEKNVIDAVAPTSQLNQLDAAYTNSIPLSWSGQDDPKGSGVMSYTLYVSTDGTNYTIVRSGITRTDTTFKGLGSTKYFFFVLATDSVGNTEALRPGAVVNTYLGSVLPLTWLYFKGINHDKNNLLEWATANEMNTKEFKVERSFDAQNFTGIGTVRAVGNSTGNSSYQYTDHDIDRLGETVMYYRLAQIDQDGRTNLSNVIRLNYNSQGLTKTIVYPNPTKGMIMVVVGDLTLIGTVATLYDEAGKLLQSIKITSVNQQFNLSSYTNGIYFIKLANKEVLKIMKH